MPNPMYEKGRRAEYQAKKELEADGFTVIRSAGSKSPIDLVGIDFNIIKLIQVKAGKNNGLKLNSEDLEKLIKIKENAPNNCKVEFWVKLKTHFQKELI